LTTDRSHPSQVPPLRRLDGSRLRVGRRLGVGGQGAVFEVADRPHQAVKVFSPRELTLNGPQLYEKLNYMVGNEPTNPTAPLQHPSLAWPQEIVLHASGEFAGFAMPLLDRHLPMHQVVNPADRSNPSLPGWIKAYDDWGRLAHTAANLSAAIQALHDASYVVGDLNESNIFVTDRALVTVIDCDSIQVRTSAGKALLCRVGKAEFTAPEVSDFKTELRTTHSDTFALAIHCFMLLMGGRHPFSGIWLGAEDKPSQIDLARQGLYCLSGSRLLQPMRGMPPADVLPQPIRDLFSKAFSYPSHPESRPSAAMWHDNLRRLADELTTCPRDEGHKYSSHLPNCPWCAMAVARTTATTRPTSRPAQVPLAQPYAVAPSLGTNQPIYQGRSTYPSPMWSRTPYQARPQAAWEPSAILAIVLAFPCWILSFPIGIYALRATRRTGRRGSGLAKWAIGLSAFNVLLMAVALLDPNLSMLSGSPTCPFTGGLASPQVTASRGSPGAFDGSRRRRSEVPVNGHSPTPLPATFLGNWRGPVRQGRAQFTVELHIRDGHIGESIGTMNLYDGANTCTFDTKLSTVSSQSIFFDITVRSGSCLSGEVQLRQTDANSLSYTWSDGAWQSSSGTLTGP
jgi:serine/threonine protein kinase